MPRFVLAGILQREYLLPPLGRPLLDAPGGSLLYAVGGLRLWEEESPLGMEIGLVGRVGEDYPRAWLRDFEARGFDTRGIRILPATLDLRSFRAYSNSLEVSLDNPVAHFARRGLPFPKALLGYQPPPPPQEDTRKPLPQAPGVGDIPKEYLETAAVHLCPLDLTSHGLLLALFQAGSAITLTLDPAAGYMLPKFLKDLRSLLKGLTAFLPSEEELRALFWGQTNDLWAMAEELGTYGCELIVVKCGARGQLLYDSVGKHRWEIPAYPARVADPSGAGDAFCGGFLAGYRQHYDALKGVLYGSVSASLKLEGSGAFYPLEVMPGLARARLEVLQEMARKK